MAARPSSLSLYDRATPAQRARVRASALLIPCMDCKAKVGQPCVSMAGIKCKPHWIRRKGFTRTG